MSDERQAGRDPAGQALVASPSSQQAVSTEGFDPSRDFPLLLAVYRGGVTRGTSEAVSFDWGERPSGKWEDELVEALYYYLNAEIKWGEPGYRDWSAIEQMVVEAIATEARRAETTQIGSVHEGAGLNEASPEDQVGGSHVEQ